MALDEAQPDDSNSNDAGSVALMLVYENTWAIPFIKAAVDQGGQVIATERIGFQDIIDALDAADAADAAN